MLQIKLQILMCTEYCSSHYMYVFKTGRGSNGRKGLCGLDHVQVKTMAFPILVSCCVRPRFLPSLLLARDYAIVKSSSQIKPRVPKSKTPQAVGKLRTWDSRWAVPSRGRRAKKLLSDLTFDDMFIRKFVRGTFPITDDNPVIVKRKENIVNVTFLLRLDPTNMYFLIGYSETLLSQWLGCKVYVRPICNRIF